MHGYKMLIVTFSRISPEGVQNKPPPDAPLWQVHCSELKAMRGQKTQKDLLTSSLAALENLDRRAGLGTQLSPQRMTESG